MRDALFLGHKVERQIVTNGSSYPVLRCVRDKYGQLSKTPVEVTQINALFHTSTVQVAKTTTDTAITKTEKAPMLLCLAEDANELMLQDLIPINGVNYRVVGFTDYQELNVAVDVSLEEVG